MPHKINSFVACYVHLVFSTHRRQPFLNPELQPMVYRYISGIVRKMGSTPLIVNGMSDHVHILLRQSQNSLLSDLVREIKKGASRYVKELGYQVEWQNGYSAFSVSGGNLLGVYQYIENQKEHHANQAYLDEIRWMEAQNRAMYEAIMKACLEEDIPNE